MKTKRGTITICIACNDHRNGMFSGRVSAIEIAGLSLAHVNGSEPSVTFIGETLMRFSRRTFEIIGTRDWVGNWCWNSVTMSKREAGRFWRYVASLEKFAPESGTTRMWRLWESTIRGKQGGAT